MNMQSAKILVGQLPNGHGIFNGGGGLSPPTEIPTRKSTWGPLYKTFNCF